MKIDRYVKGLLTAMTVCLILIVIKMYEFIPSAQAAPAASVSTLSNPSGNVVDVRIVDGEGLVKLGEKWGNRSYWRVQQ